MNRTDLITVAEARERLGISKVTIARLIREGTLTTYPNPLDRRQKLVERQAVERLEQYRALPPNEPRPSKLN